MPLPIHVAAVQYATEMYDRTTNTDRALHLLDDAAHAADLVVLPETSFTGYWLGNDMAKFAQPVPDSITSIVSEIAVARNAHICYSTAERDGDKIYNTAVLVGADGSLIGKHRKAHLFRADVESGFTPGDALEVFDTHLGKIGILICYDTFHIESVRVLDLKGAQLVLVPAVGLVLPDVTLDDTLYSWETVLRANAKYGRCHVVWANKIGMDRDLVAVGNSMIVDPDGRIVARGGVEEEVVRAEITLQPKKPRPGRRPALYAPICEG